MIPLPSALLSTGKGVIWPCPTAPAAFASNCEFVLVTTLPGATVMAGAP